MTTAVDTAGFRSARAATVGGEPPTQSHPLAALGTVTRFVVRRDRLRMTIWVAAIVGIVAASVASVVALYDTPEELQQYADLATIDAAFKAIAGPGYGLERNPTEGAVVMNETNLYTLVAVALMAMFLVTRHTRAEEETERAELVRAAPVGRLSALVATMAWVSFGVVLVGVGLTVTMVAFGLPLAGSVAFGAASAGVGLVTVGLTGVAAQLTTTARATNALAGVVIGAFFVLRAVGDVGSVAFRWASPLGWAQAIRAYADERWWVLVPLLATAAALIAVAVSMSLRRDLGAGAIGQRPGPAVGSPRLATPLALAVRLQRATVIGWAVGMAIMGLFFGIVADEADAFAENEAVADMLTAMGEGSLTEMFLATMVVMLALMASGFTVASVLRSRTEEQRERVGPILATPVSRVGWLASHVTVSVVGSATIMLAGGLAAGLGYVLQIRDVGELVPVLVASLATVPALAVVAGVTTVLHGWLPRWAYVAWAYLAYTVVVGFLANTLDLPEWSRQLSPYHHLPALPAASFDPVPLLVLTAIAAALFALGAAGIHRRDIE